MLWARWLRMAVLSEPVEDAHASDQQPQVIVSADDGDTGRRLMAALADRDLRTSLRLGAASGNPVPAVDSKAIIVLAGDINQPGGMATLRRLRRGARESPIVIVSPPATGTGVRRALDAGADAIVFESELDATLAVAVSAVASGQSVVPRNLRASVEQPVLSHRERQVLMYVSKGLTNAQIAVQLFLAESTIKSHLSSAFGKLGVRSRKEAAAMFRTLEHVAGGESSNAQTRSTAALPEQAAT